MATSDAPLSVPNVTLAVARGAPVTTPTGSTPAERQFSIKIDAVGGAVGANAQHSSGILNGKYVFTGDAGGTTYTDEFLIDGQNTLRLSGNAGATGFGTFGGTLDYATHPAIGTKLYKGDEFWVRCKLIFPSASWQWNPSGGANKFLRNRVVSPDGSTNGYLDTYLNGAEPPARFTGSNLLWIYEGRDQWVTGPYTGLGFDVVRTFEMYVKLDDVSGDLGGSAKQRVWADGQLIIENTKATMVTPNDEQMQARLFTYYGDPGNNSLPVSDYHIYVKDYIVQSSVPSQTDAAGNPYIGV